MRGKCWAHKVEGMTLMDMRLNKEDKTYEGREGHIKARVGQMSNIYGQTREGRANEGEGTPHYRNIRADEGRQGRRRQWKEENDQEDGKDGIEGTWKRRRAGHLDGPRAHEQHLKWGGEAPVPPGCILV